MRRFGIVVSLCSLAALPGHVPAQSVTQGAPVYFKPAELKPSGQAPAMKVQAISDQGGQKEYAVIFY